MKNFYIIISLLTLLGCEKLATGPVEVIPLAPTELKATIVSKDQVDLYWKDNSSNETGFKIERKTDLGNFTEIGSTAADVSAFSDKTVNTNTNYTYRIYSFNQVGKSNSYSNEVSIKMINIPTLTTTAIIDTTTTSPLFITGGNISSDGGSAITARGVVWGITNNPTISLQTKTSNGDGAGLYQSTITGLSLNTKYYVRAYATNSVGTGYGEEKSFNTFIGITVAGSNGKGSASNQLFAPYGVFVDELGNIYIGDSNNNRIQKWAPGANSGITVAGVREKGSGGDQLNTPMSVFVNKGNIYIADKNNHRIQQISEKFKAIEGPTVAGGNGQGAAANQLNTPSGVFIDASENVYVADALNNRIQKFPPKTLMVTPSGTTVAGGNGQGAAANQFSTPTSVFLDASGNIYVVDASNDRIQKWTPGATSGTTVAGGNGRGLAANQLYNPSEGFLDASGNIYVADTGNHRIQKWAPGATSGTTVAGGNGMGSAAKQLFAPQGVFVDTSGNIYVTDTGNHRIQKWAKP